MFVYATASPVPLAHCCIVILHSRLTKAQHAFIRDELSKGRYDAALAKVCFDMLLELFHRKLCVDLGNKVAKTKDVEHVC